MGLACKILMTSGKRDKELRYYECNEKVEHGPWPVSQWMNKGLKGRIFQEEEIASKRNGGMKEHGT